MNHLLLRLLPLLLCLCLLCSPALGEGKTLRVANYYPDSPVWQAFRQAHPDIFLETAPMDVYATNDLVNRLVTGNVPMDTLQLFSSNFDVGLIMAKGYCADVSSRSALMEKVNRMHPAIRSQVLREGKLYGFPIDVNVSFWAWDLQGWEAAGLDARDAPTSFTGLMDFLEGWVQRIENQPEDEICVFNLFDSDLYDENSYVSLLVNLLMDNYAMQRQYAGEALQFDTPLFRQLLERATQLGRALYAAEPKAKTDLPLFQEGSQMVPLWETWVPLRMTEDQPRLLKAYLTLSAVNAASAHPQEAMAFLEEAAAHSEPILDAYLYVGAQAPEDPQYAETVALWETKVAQAQVDNAPASQRKELEETLSRYQEALLQVSAPENRFLVAPESLSQYQALADSLYFAAPSVFDLSDDDRRDLRQIRDLYCAGKLTADEFIRRLDQTAGMIAAEMK